MTPDISVYTLTPERIAASLAAVVALTGAVIGGLALARAAGRVGVGYGRRGAVAALVMGPIGFVVGGLWWWLGLWSGPGRFAGHRAGADEDQPRTDTEAGGLRRRGALRGA